MFNYKLRNNILNTWKNVIEIYNWEDLIITWVCENEINEIKFVDELKRIWNNKEELIKLIKDKYNFLNKNFNENVFNNFFNLKDESKEIIQNIFEKIKKFLNSKWNEDIEDLEIDEINFHEIIYNNTNLKRFIWKNLFEILLIINKIKKSLMKKEFDDYLYSFFYKSLDYKEMRTLIDYWIYKNNDLVRWFFENFRLLNWNVQESINNLFITIYLKDKTDEKLLNFQKIEEQFHSFIKEIRLTFWVDVNGSTFKNWFFKLFKEFINLNDWKNKEFYIELMKKIHNSDSYLSDFIEIVNWKKQSSLKELKKLESFFI